MNRSCAIQFGLKASAKAIWHSVNRSQALVFPQKYGMIKLSMSKLYVLPVKLRVRLTISHLEQGKLHLSSGALGEHLHLHLITMCCSETREKKKRLIEESALARERQRRQTRETRAVASLASRAFSHARGHFCLWGVSLYGLRKNRPFVA